MPLDFSKNISHEELVESIQKHIIPVDTAFNYNLTVGQVLKALQGKKVSHEVRYFYAIDEHDRLKGVVPTRDLLFSDPQRKIRDIAQTNVVTINYNSTLEGALRVIKEHELLALPVTDGGRLLGIFELPHPIISRTSTRDTFQLIGLSIEQGKLTSPLVEYRYRMPWLTCNLIAGLLCAFIANIYSAVLDKVVVISMFIPLVLTLGESVSLQSMTLSLQFLHYKKIPWKQVVQRMFTEWRTSFLLGSTCAILVALVYLLWNSTEATMGVMTAISLSIFLSMIAVTSIGSSLPILLHAMKLDPKVASGPVVLMITDITITTVYLSLATYLLL